MTNRNRLVRWFITYPKCELTKMAFSREILQVHACKYLKAVQETHQDGTHHLHVYLVLENAISHAQFLNFFKKVYPNDWKRIHLKPVRNPVATLQYLDKEDTEPFVVGNLPVPKNRRTPRQMYLDGTLSAWKFFSKTIFPLLPDENICSAFNSLAPYHFTTCFPGVRLPSHFTECSFLNHDFTSYDEPQLFGAFNLIGCRNMKSRN